MGQKSTKENKNEYQLAREQAKLTREQASEATGFMSASRIEKIESEKSGAHPDEIIAMAEAYKAPSLCNYYCTHRCDIGKIYVPNVEITNLAQITLGMLSTLNAFNNDKQRLIDISADGKITEDEYADFVEIQDKLDKISLTVSSLQLWIEQEIAIGNIDKAKLDEIREKMNYKK